MQNRAVDVQAFFTDKGISFKRSGSELVSECPYCGKDEHLYVNVESGLWKCHRCSEKGSFTTLAKKFGGDVENNIVSFRSEFSSVFPVKEAPPIKLGWEQYSPFESALKKDDAAMRWLREERLLTDGTIEHFRLGKKSGKFSKKNNAQVDWVMIPLVRDGAMVNVKYRTTGEFKKDYTQIQGGTASLFNHDGMRQDEPLFLCEGEFDAMVLWQNGYTNVVSTSGGAGTFPTEFYDKVVSLKPQIVYIVYDTDEPGKKASEELQRRFGDLSRIVDLGKYKDVTEFFKEKTKEDFKTLVDQSSLSVIESVSGSVDVYTALIEQVHALETRQVQPTEVVTPWARVNHLIDGGMEPGEMIVLSARAKIGKTTFALNIATELALKETPVLFFCLEMRPERIMKKMCSYLLKKPFRDLSVSALSTLAPVVANMPFYFGYSWKDIRIEKIQSIFERAVSRFGIKFIVFDNLHYLVRHPTNVVQEIALYSKSFKRMAESLKVPIMLIAQPRKTSEEMVSSEDLKDSSAIKADADKIILLHRTQMLTDVTGAMAGDPTVSGTTQLDEALHPLTIVKVDASRYSGGGTSMLWYNGSISEMTEATQKQISDFKVAYSKNSASRQSHSGHHKSSHSTEF